MGEIKNGLESLTKHKRKFLATLAGDILVFILAIADKVEGALAIDTIKYITLGFVLLEIAGRTKLLSNGKN